MIDDNVTIAALAEVGIPCVDGGAHGAIIDESYFDQATPEVTHRAKNLALVASGEREVTFDEFIEFCASRPCNHDWLRYHGIEVPS